MAGPVDMRNIKLTLEYDGTDFSGWQIQPRRRTVQGVLAESLQTILGEPVKIIGSGRTDAGVHARGQVANFTTAAAMPLTEMRRALNGLLPDDVVVRRIRQAAPDFHARFDAVRRDYRYRITLRPTALRRRYVWHVRWPLDLTLMQQGAALLPGTHDFSACCLGPEKNTHCRCRIIRCSLRRREGEIRFRISANRFLHSMVRIIIGRLVELGRGKMAPEQFADLLRGKDPSPPAPLVAPAQGLCLICVKYPE
jgi:tRNA pseudouridine38-40 synthase